MAWKGIVVGFVGLITIQAIFAGPVNRTADTLEPRVNSETELNPPPHPLPSGPSELTGELKCGDNTGPISYVKRIKCVFFPSPEQSQNPSGQGMGIINEQEKERVDVGNKGKT